MGLLVFIGIVSKGSICVMVDPDGRNSGWEIYFLLNLSHKFSSATAEHHSEGQVQKSIGILPRIEDSATNRGFILTFSVSFPVLLKLFSLQWNTFSSRGILFLQLQPTASLSGHFCLKVGQLETQVVRYLTRSQIKWDVTFVSSRIFTFK